MSSPLSPQLFAILSGLVEDRFGIEYSADDLPLFSDKVTTRATEAGFQSVLDYYYFLRYDAGASAELQALADALVVGETYFFRELDAARAAVHEVVVPAVARRGRARVWSAACATGEEPLSLAMLLAEAGVADKCEIVATDLSARALGRAHEGVYGARSLRLLPPEAPPASFSPALAAIVSRSIVREGASRARVAPELVATIDYRKLNLLDANGVTALGHFDLVLCRNVLIYFADPTVIRVVSSLANALVPDGALLVGASESLLRFGTVLRCVERAGTFFYVKAA